METVIMIKCLCGREVTLEIVGGQYQNTYQGECECDWKWSLDEQSEVIEEISEATQYQGGQNVC